MYCGAIRSRLIQLRNAAPSPAAASSGISSASASETASGCSCADHRHLVVRAVAADRLGGDLDRDALAEGLPHRADRGPIERRVERMPALVAAHVQVQDGRAGGAAQLGLARDLGRRQRQSGMVRLGPPRAVRRDHDDQRDHAAARPTAASAAAIACAEPLDDLLELAVADDVGRRQQQMVARAAVDRAAHRIAQQPARHGLGLDPRVQPVLGRERPLARAVGDELQALEQAAAADLADVRMIAEARGRAARAACAPCCRTRPSSCSSAIVCCTASAAAQASGWPM